MNDVELFELVYDVFLTYGHRAGAGLLLLLWLRSWRGGRVALKALDRVMEAIRDEHEDQQTTGDACTVAIVEDIKLNVALDGVLHTGLGTVDAPERLIRKRLAKLKGES